MDTQWRLLLLNALIVNADAPGKRWIAKIPQIQPSEGVQIIIYAAVSAFLGVGIVSVILGALLYLDRRKQKTRDERPPVRSKLLRAAGHSLQIRLQELGERVFDLIGYSLIGAVVFSVSLVAFFPLFYALIFGSLAWSEVINAKQSYMLLVLGVLFLVGAVLCFSSIRKLFNCHKEMRNVRLGLRGEQAVAEALMSERICKAGYRVFHDVPGDGPWNIDHVVVGPGGIYVLETKTRRRRKARRVQAEHDVVYDGKMLIFPWCEDAEAVRQVERNAAFIQRYLADFLPPNSTVQPVIVIPGWHVESKGNYRVKAMPQTYLMNTYLPSEGKWSSEEIRRVCCRLDDRCRDVEF